MARHKKTTDEKYNQPFATRFRLLMNTKKRTSQAEIADAVGKSRQVISQYYNGESEPPFDTLVKIAQYFDVTVDYMIGATDVSSTSMDVKKLVRLTGISEENTLLILANHQLEKGKKEILNSSGISGDGMNICPRGALLNALIEYAFKADTNSYFMEIVNTLETPSSKAFINKIANDEAFCDVVHKEAIRLGVEAFFGRGDSDEEADLAALSHGMWNLTPEDAFEYYCDRVGEGLKRYLIAKFAKTARWSDIEPYREKIREKIDRFDNGWDEMMQEVQKKWPASKNEAEATE